MTDRYTKVVLVVLFWTSVVVFLLGVLIKINPGGATVAEIANLVIVVGIVNTLLAIVTIVTIYSIKTMDVDQREWTP